MNLSKGIIIKNIFEFRLPTKNPTWKVELVIPFKRTNKKYRRFSPYSIFFYLEISRMGIWVQFTNNKNTYGKWIYDTKF